MKKALIGYTGFVGGNIYKKLKFDDLYNSKNIEEIQGKKYDLVISAGVSAVKWWANQNEHEDWEKINVLLQYLLKAKINYIIWISTIDVFPQPIEANENTIIEKTKLESYGKNRLLAEEFIRSHFSNYSIIRLPGLFGEGLKKNFIFDIIHNQYNSFVHPESIFQFYNLNNIKFDLNVIMENKIPIINITSEPISVQEIASYVLKRKIAGNFNLKPVFYNMKTKYAHLFNKKGPYLYLKNQILKDIKEFIHKEKSKL
ncbi:MAG: hypothetical protein Fur009_6760 [Candidatus Microgenomates bacterium]